MITVVIAHRYAKALMKLAVAADQIEPVTEGLDTVADALADSDRLADFLAEPKISLTAKQQAVTDLLAAAQVPTLVATFVRFVTGKRRILLLGEIRTVFHRLADERMGRAHAEVVVAAPLSADQESRLKEQLERLSGKQITLQVQVEPEILGGAVTRIGSTVWDGSLRGRLDQVRQTIIEG